MVNADNGKGPFLDTGSENGRFQLGAFQWEAVSEGVTEIQFDKSLFVDAGMPIDVSFDSLTLFVDDAKQFLLGDVNCDGVVNLLDVAPFKALIVDGEFSEKGDINRDGEVNLLDVAPFTDLLIPNP